MRKKTLATAVITTAALVGVPSVIAATAVLAAGSPSPRSASPTVSPSPSVVGSVPTDGAGSEREAGGVSGVPSPGVGEQAATSEPQGTSTTEASSTPVTSMPSQSSPTTSRSAVPPTPTGEGTGEATATSAPVESPTPRVAPDAVASHGDWYVASRGGAPLPAGSVFSATEVTDGGTVEHRFVTGADGKVYVYDPQAAGFMGAVVDPGEVTLEFADGGVRFVDEPLGGLEPTTSPSTTPEADIVPAPEESSSGSIEQGDPVEPGQQTPGGLDGNSDTPGSGDMPDGTDGGAGSGDGSGTGTDSPGGDGPAGPHDTPDEADTPADPTDPNTQPGDNPGSGEGTGEAAPTSAPPTSRTRDPETGNGNAEAPGNGPVGADWAPPGAGRTGGVDGPPRDYSDPVPQAPDDGAVNDDTIAGPGEATSAGGETDQVVDARPSGTGEAGENGRVSVSSFPWPLAALIGVGAAGLLVVVFVFARRGRRD